MAQTVECFYGKCGECITKNECSCSCHTRVYMKTMPPLIPKKNWTRVLSQGVLYEDYNYQNRSLNTKSRGRPPKTRANKGVV